MKSTLTDLNILNPYFKVTKVPLLTPNRRFQVIILFVAVFGAITAAFGIDSFTARQNWVSLMRYLAHFCFHEWDYTKLFD